MKKLLCSLVLAGSLIAPLGTASLASAASTTQYNTNTDKCKVAVVGNTNTVGKSDSRFVENGDGTVSAKVVVSGTEPCTQTVSIASWKAPYGVNGYTPIKDQTLVDSKTVTLGLGTHTITIKIADCRYQVDLLYGAKTTTPSGTAEYPAEQKLGWVQAGTKVCAKPVTTPNPAPTPAPVTPTTPTPPANGGGDQPAPAAELPNTGAGNIAAVFFVTTLVAAAAYRFTFARQRA
jgi:hypothetical protein